MVLDNLEVHLHRLYRIFRLFRHFLADLEHPAVLYYLDYPVYLQDKLAQQHLEHLELLEHLDNLLDQLDPEVLELLKRQLYLETQHSR